MDKIFESIEEWMRNLLTGMVSSNLTNMFTDVNEKTGDIASQVGQTPQGWNGSIFKEEHHRHDVRPGLSGWAQINGRNAIDSWEQRFQYDLEYDKNVSEIFNIFNCQ